MREFYSRLLSSDANRQHRVPFAPKAATASENQPEIDRDEVVVCMVLAFTSGNA